MTINIYTDGACSGNPGRGGFGIVMEVPEKSFSKNFAQGFKLTTNNRMELLAVIVALEQLKNPEDNVHIFTDSKYVTEAINKKWLQNWVKIGFKNKKNPDLWQRLLPLIKKHKVTFNWIKGHAGHFQNEICDQLAVKASKGDNLEVDSYFEESRNGGLFK